MRTSRADPSCSSSSHAFSKMQIVQGLPSRVPLLAQTAGHKNATHSQQYAYHNFVFRISTSIISKQRKHFSRNWNSPISASHTQPASQQTAEKFTTNTYPHIHNVVTCERCLLAQQEATEALRVSFIKDFAPAPQSNCSGCVQSPSPPHA